MIIVKKMDNMWIMKRKWDEDEEIYERVLAKKQKEEEEELREKEMSLLERWKKNVLG